MSQIQYLVDTRQPCHDRHGLCGLQARRQILNEHPICRQASSVLDDSITSIVDEEAFLSKCFSHYCRDEFYDSWQQNKLIESELEDSDEDFEDEEAMYLNSEKARTELDSETRAKLRIIQQFDTERGLQQDERQKKSIQQTMTRIQSVRYLNQHLIFRKSYVSHIYLTGFYPRIWREIRVPAQLSLAVFHDKVLTPLFDWKRNFHGFQFMVPHRADKYVSFGPARSTAVDMMWIRWQSRIREAGAHMVEASKVFLSDVLYLKGSTLRYIYDLGDRYHHTIELKDVHFHRPDEQLKIEILGGSRAGPPENANRGGIGKCLKYVEILNVIKKNKDFEKFMELLIQPNIKGRFWTPEWFDIHRCRRRMKRYFGTMLSRMDAKSMHQSGPKLLRGTEQEGEGSDDEKNVKESQERHRVERLCFYEYCKGKDGEVRGCGEAKSVFYCSKQCQKRHWNTEHRYYCFNHRQLRIL